MPPMLMSPSKIETAAHSCHFILHTQCSSQTAALMTLFVLTFTGENIRPRGGGGGGDSCHSGGLWLWNDDHLETVTSQHE